MEHIDVRENRLGVLRFYGIDHPLTQQQVRVRRGIQILEACFEVNEEVSRLEELHVLEEEIQSEHGITMGIAREGFATILLDDHTAPMKPSNALHEVVQDVDAAESESGYHEGRMILDETRHSAMLEQVPISSMVEGDQSTVQVVRVKWVVFVISSFTRELRCDLVTGLG